MGRNPKWLNELRRLGGEFHEASGVSVFPSGSVNATIYKQPGGYLNFFSNKRNWKVHRVVAECFIPNPEGKPFVNHKDGNKWNAAVSNLEWVTHQENMIHAYATGLNKYVPRRTFTKREILYIRRATSSLYKLAEKYRVSYQIIYNIHYLKTHKNV